jgi:hypothetical protein
VAKTRFTATSSDARSTESAAVAISSEPVPRVDLARRASRNHSHDISGNHPPSRASNSAGVTRSCVTAQDYPTSRVAAVHTAIPCVWWRSALRFEAPAFVCCWARVANGRLAAARRSAHARVRSWQHPKKHSLTRLVVPVTVKNLRTSRDALRDFGTTYKRDNHGQRPPDYQTSTLDQPPRRPQGSNPEIHNGGSQVGRRWLCPGIVTTNVGRSSVPSRPDGQRRQTAAEPEAPVARRRLANHQLLSSHCA